jgi:hypothetical protein
VRRVDDPVIRIEPVAMARGPEEVEAAFATISQEGADAVVVQGIFFSKAIAELALEYRLPTASVVPQFAQAGGLLSYGADIRDIYRRSAVEVSAIGIKADASIFKRVNETIQCANRCWRQVFARTPRIS